MQHHAFVIEADAEKGVELALAWITKELDMTASGNPDVVVRAYGLLSVEDARAITELASQAPFVGETRAIVIAANRAYHEAQNALLKVFEEPAPGTCLFLILPTLGGLLPTLRSRVVVLETPKKDDALSETAREFMSASREKRAALIKRLTSGKDEETRRAHREEAITLLNDLEATAAHDLTKHQKLLEEIALLRGYLYDRSAPVKQILEHLAIVTPAHLL